MSFVGGSRHRTLNDWARTLSTFNYERRGFSVVEEAPDCQNESCTAARDRMGAVIAGLENDIKVTAEIGRLLVERNRECEEDLRSKDTANQQLLDKLATLAKENGLLEKVYFGGYVNGANSKADGWYSASSRLLSI